MTGRIELIGGVEVKITKKSNIKNLYIRVNPPEGNVTLSAPLNYLDDEIRLFVLKKLPEINAVRLRMRSQVRQTKREFISGESHYLWGKPYRLDVEVGTNKYSIKKMPNKILFSVPEGASAEHKEKIFNEWYRSELKRVLQGLIPSVEERMNFGANEYRIKDMKTRWGTCNIDKKRIWLNLQLAKKPIECLEYVLVHEMVHLLEKNHTHRFNALVSEYYPTWKDVEKTLESMPLDYLEKGEATIDEEEG
ncbi:MAG: SprT family zinc-dependent metalloprotease [Dialister micraerophilus]|uniref:M48 family metallopeptidase n=1 Tax=Dialister micraerophilus TaxID=309120 RepID=UPI00255030CA|nr:SprT family zinc-dependent metalloprotease [Dialister micraerophilus]MDK8253319.1 SprT family zinc-dependent metalloprotease [Dialister micraerophilus]